MRIKIKIEGGHTLSRDSIRYSLRRVLMKKGYNVSTKKDNKIEYLEATNE